MKALAAILLMAVLSQDDIDAKLKEFADTMKASKGDAEQIKAIHDLAATRSFKASTKLIQVVAGPYSEAVRIAAADAIGKIGDVRAGAGLMGFVSSLGPVLKSEVPSRVVDQKVGEAAVRAVGTLRDKSATKQLAGMTISANVPLMSEVVQALGKIRDPGCMDALLKLHYAANAPRASAPRTSASRSRPTRSRRCAGSPARSTPPRTSGTSGTRASAARSSSRPRNRSAGSRLK